MADQEWYKKQVDGQWYQLQANSPEDADAKFAKINYPADVAAAGRSTNLPQPKNVGTISSGRPKYHDVFGAEKAISDTEGFLEDIKSGPSMASGVPEYRTWAGKALGKIGWQPMGHGIMSQFASGPIAAVPEIAHGAATAMRPGQTTRGAMEMIGGTFHGTGLLAGAVSPEFLPATAKFSAIQEATAKLGEKMGFSPETNEWVSMLVAIGGTGATLDPRVREAALKAEANKIRASRGFGASVDEAAVRQAAEQNVAKAEAQANTAMNIAKRTGQNVAEVLSTGAQSIVGAPKPEEDLTNKFGTNAKSAPPIKPPLTAEDIKSRIAQAEATNKVKTRPMSPTERVQQIAEANKPKPLATPRVPEAEPALEAERRGGGGFSQEEKVQMAKSEVENLKMKVERERAEAQQSSGTQAGTSAFNTVSKLQAAEAKLEKLQGKAPEAPPESGPSIDERIARAYARYDRAGMNESQIKQQMVKDFPDQAADILRGFEASIPQEKAREQSQAAAGVASPPEATKPPVKPSEAARPTEGRGEPVRPAEVAKVSDDEKLKALFAKTKSAAPSMPTGELGKVFAESKSVGQGEGSWFDKAKAELFPGKKDLSMAEMSQAANRGLEMRKAAESAGAEPRSLRGDLGERPPAPEAPKAQFTGKLDYAKRLELTKARVEAMQQDPKFKGVAKARLQEIAAEEIRKQFGGFGGSSPEDIRARRNAKINNWVDVLRNEKSDPKSIDDAYKNLLSFGLDHNEIIRRVSGAEDFVKTPEDIKREAWEKFSTPREERGQEPVNWEERGKLEGIVEGTMRNLKAKGDAMDVINRFEDYLKTDEGRWAAPNYKDADLMEKGRMAVEHWLSREPLLSDQEARDVARRDMQKMRDDIAAMRVQDPDVKELQRMMSMSDERPDTGSLRSIRESDKGLSELKRMWDLKDERGFWRMWPAKKAQPPRAGNSALDQLTAKLESSLRASQPDDSRMKFAERLDKTLTEGWDKTQIALGKLTAQALALKDMYFRPPAMSDYNSALGRFSGSLNRSAWELRQFTKEIKSTVPDARRREAITNWIQANGDDTVLADRANRSTNKSLRAGYEAARTLTQDEIGIAKMIQTHFDNRLRDAIRMDLLKDGLENYVPQIWKPKDQGSAHDFFSSIHRSGTLKPDFNAARKRVFDSYFEGEQKGFKPVNKDIGFLVASWDKAFNQAIASKAFIKDLTNATASDGKPLVAPSGHGKALYGTSAPSPGDTAEAYFIYPKSTPDETENYRALNHPALQKWTWVAKDSDGAPIMMKGELRVHPEAATKLNNIVNRGRWAAEHPTISSILKGQAFFKATLLSMSPFHQIQEGTHAIFHRVNPFSPPKIDLADPTVGKLLDHGLVIGNYDPLAAFEEGVYGKGGLVGKIPGIGGMMQKYSDYLFSDYIPRLKTRMATEAYQRNLKYYEGAINKGEVTRDQIAQITASQANAAFGELNYMMLGRNPGTQAALRMMFLAPDFLEARTRFVGQALHPYGREQFMALFVRGAAGMYITSRILNKLLDDDYHWDKPFSLVAKGYEYKLRTLPGDIWHLIEDPESFLQHRVNPTLVHPFMEALTGRDDFGRRRTIGEQAMDFVRGITPIPFQGGYKSGDQNYLDSALQSLGVTRSKYRTRAGALAHQYAVEDIRDATSHHISEIVRDIDNGKLDGAKISDLLSSGKMNPIDLQKALKLASQPELYRDYNRLTIEKKMEVLRLATPEEAAEIIANSRKEIDVTRLLPEQREKFMKEFANK